MVYLPYFNFSYKALKLQASGVPRIIRFLIFSYLGFLYLHNVGLAVGNAVVDVVDVGAQRLQLFIQGGQGPVSICTVQCHLLSLFGHSLPPSGQLLTLLQWWGSLRRRERKLEQKGLISFPGLEETQFSYFALLFFVMSMITQCYGVLPLAVGSYPSPC